MARLADAQNIEMPTSVEELRNLREKLGRKATTMIRMMRNVSPQYPVPSPPRGQPSLPAAIKGAIVAGSEYEYFYVWTRDSAIIMNKFIDFYEKETDPAMKKVWSDIYWDWVGFNKIVLNISPFGPAAAKFLANGTKHNHPFWGEPQDDGPALRALVNMRMMRIFIREGCDRSVLERLYNKDLTSLSLIKTDLEYTTHHYFMKSYDIWEEKFAHHYATKVFQWAALHEGAKFAQVMGDVGIDGAAEVYRTSAIEAKKWVLSFRDEKNHFIRAYRDWVGRDGQPIKENEAVLDVAVLLAHLIVNPYGGLISQTGDPDDNFIGIKDDLLLGTVQKLESTFKAEYSINQDKHLAIATGRYPKDHYRGGNPWLLSMAGVGEFYVLLAEEWLKSGLNPFNEHTTEFYRDLAYAAAGDRWIQMTKKNLKYSNFEGIQRQSYPYLKSLDVLGSADEGAKSELATKRFIRFAARKGHAYEDEVYLHQNSDGSLPEQISRDIKAPDAKITIQDLGWSCAAGLRLIDERAKLASRLRMNRRF